jgi:methylated-DNA-[protein]-cysteine S-methyltransferase
MNTTPLMSEPHELQFDRIDDHVAVREVGTILLVADGTRLAALDFAGFETRMHALLATRYRQPRIVERRDPAGLSTRVRAYLAGDRSALDSVDVDGGGTPFQRLVWNALRAIPSGTTTTYGEIARRIGRPQASRAVGLANAKNPIAIVVPCHRVVGANGALTGYAGGLERKRWLLRHEGVALAL